VLITRHASYPHSRQHRLLPNLERTPAARKWRRALPVLVLSLAAFLINLLYTYVLTDGGAVMGRQMVITSAIITGLLVFFSWYSRFMAARHVLR